MNDQMGSSKTSFPRLIEYERSNEVAKTSFPRSIEMICNNLSIIKIIL
jgi:hypothetical protein